MARAQQLEWELAGAERANRELERLSRDAAHDLRAPLQTIAGYVHLLSHYAGANLDAKSQDCLAAILETVTEMGALVEASFEYVRTSSASNRADPVDGHELMRRVVALTNGEAERRAAVVEIDDLPPLVGNEVQLIRLFENLLLNAVQASATDAGSHVRVSGRRVAGGCELAVSDNGRGVLPEDRERIFEPFERCLHGESPDPHRGAGMGLAIARRIAERHGGSIGVEDSDGNGSRFVVFIPDAPSAEAVEWLQATTGPRPRAHG